MTRHGADTVAEDYCEKQGCEDIENCGEICDISIMKDRLTEAYREGYHDGEKVGREKVLDELVKFFTIGWFSQSKTVPRDVLLGKLKALRQEGKAIIKTCENCYFFSKGFNKFNCCCSDTCLDFSRWKPQQEGKVEK